MSDDVNDEDFKRMFQECERRWKRALRMDKPANSDQLPQDKRPARWVEATVAVSWCLVVLLVPVLGALLFWMFGYNYVHRRVRRKALHRTVRLGAFLIVCATLGYLAATLFLYP